MRRRRFATVLVGPSALQREGLARILSATDFRIVALASSVEALLQSKTPNESILLVMDVGDNPDTMIGQIELFKRHYRDGRIAVLASQCRRKQDIAAAFRAGANAYFVEVATCDTFVKSLELVALGETILPSEVLSRLLDRSDETIGHSGRKNVLVENAVQSTPHLSARERSILRCLADGNSNKAIARKFNIAEATVKVHVKCILRKIRVNNRTQAAIWAMNNDSLIWDMDHAKAISHQPSHDEFDRIVPGPPVLQPPTGSDDSMSTESAPRAELPRVVQLVGIGVNRRKH